MSTQRSIADKVYSELLGDPRRQVRLQEVNAVCNSSETGSWYNSFLNDLEAITQKLNLDIDSLFKGRDVLDIGCGRYGGLADYLLCHGARSYLGVDIGERHLEQSRLLVRDGRARFIADDPVFILSRFSRRFLTISAGLMMDQIIIKSGAYGSQIVHAIAKNIASKNFAIHQVNEYFDALFAQEGLKSMAEGFMYKTKVYQRR